MWKIFLRTVSENFLKNLHWQKRARMIPHSKSDGNDKSGRE